MAQDDGKPKKLVRRYGFELNETLYPQKSPQETMKSIALALKRGKVDYMLAFLVDPVYVDYWVNRYKKVYKQGREEARVLLAFDRLARETNQYYLDEPYVLRELRTFAKEGEWKEDGDLAEGTVKSLPARKMYLRRIDERWVLENGQQDRPAK